MANPTRSVVNETYEGLPIQCCKLVVTESADLKLPEVCAVNGNYIFQLVVKSDATRTLTVAVGSVIQSIQVTSSFARYVSSFLNVSVATSRDCYITFPAGTYYVYNVQLERATTPSSWRPAPEDAEDYTDEQVTILDNSLTQQDVFNRLTNNGQTQGIYLQNGKVYINASFIQSGTVSANYISGGSIDANDVAITNLIADHVVSSGGGGAAKLESESAYLDLRHLTNSVWQQRIGLFISNSDEGIIRVSSGDVDANGAVLGGASSRSFIESDRILAGVDQNQVLQGEVRTKDLYARGDITVGGDVSAGGTISASGAISATGNISSSGNISASSGNGTFKFVNADTIGSEKASNTIDMVNDTWTFSITGCRFICIEGQAGSLEIQTTVIPCAAIAGYTYGWRLATGTTAYTVSRSGSTCTVKLTTASNSTCRLLRCYSIV